MMKNRLFLFMLMLIAALALTACGGDSNNTTSESSSTTENDEKEKISIMLDWYPNAVHSYLYVAEEKGFFDEENLDVDFQFPANPTDPLTLAASGKVTMGLYYQPDVIMAKANEGIPVKSIAAVVREPLNHLVYSEDNPIASPKELVDKKVGYPGIPINEALVKTMIEHDGGNYNDLEMINVEFELGSSLVSGQVDAVSGMFVNHEVPLLRSEGYEVDYFNPVDYGVPSYYEVVAVTSDETWENKQEIIEAFWKAARKGFDFMADNPEEALDILLSNQDQANFPLDKDVETESLNILLPKMKSDDGFATQEKESWQATANWLKEYDLIEDVPDIDDLIIQLEP